MMGNLGGLVSIHGVLNPLLPNWPRFLHSPIKRASLPLPPKLSLPLARCFATARSFGSLDAQSPAQIKERSQLKQELFRAIEATEGALDDNCLAIVASLEKLNPGPDIRVDPGVLKGCFLLAKANFKEKRTDGKKRLLGYQGSSTTLGATTFNVLKPIDLEIALFNFYQHTLVENDDSYNLIVEFTVPNPDEKDSPVQGLIINKARFDIGGSNRLEVEFLSCGMKPRFPEKDLKVWLKIFKESNPGMDENGCIDIPVLMPIRVWTDVLYMDEEVRIMKGHRAGVSVLTALKEPIVHI